MAFGERKLATSSGGGSSKDARMAELLATLLVTAPQTHMTHLKTKSFAAHMALGDFYGGLPDLVDTVAELYQGATETLLSFPTLSCDPINTVEGAIEHLRRLYEMVTEVQSECMYSEISNELDNIKAAINSTKYKLIFLQ